MKKVPYGGLRLYMLYKVEFLLKHYIVFVLNSITTHSLFLCKHVAVRVSEEE